MGTMIMKSFLYRECHIFRQTQILLSETQVWVVNVGLASHFCWFNRSTMGRSISPWGAANVAAEPPCWADAQRGGHPKMGGLRYWVYHCSMIVILVGSQTSNRITNSKTRSTMIKSPHSYALLLCITMSSYLGRWFNIPSRCWVAGARSFSWPTGWEGQRRPS